VLNVFVLLPEYWLLVILYPRETGHEAGRTIELAMIVCIVKCSCPATRELVVGEVNFGEVVCEDGRMIELAYVCAQC
jgi:hypothetical protein